MKRLLAAGLVASAAIATIVTLTAGELQTGISREEIALAADRIRADRWYDAVTRPGAGQAVRQNRRTDMDVLLSALRQPYPELRAAALRELGRFELASNATLIGSFLQDPAAIVKREAADALVQTLWDKSVAEAAPAVDLLDKHLRQERSAEIVGVLWIAIAELPIEAQIAQKYEARFVNEIRQTTPLRFSALEALLVLTEHRRGRPLMADTEDRVMYWARRGLAAGETSVMIGTDSLGPTIRYLEILQAAQADADDIAFSAASFVCRGPLGCGADIRRLGVDLLNSANPAHVPALLSAARNRGDVQAASAAIRKLITSPGVSRCQLLNLAEGTPAVRDVITALADDPVERTGECGDWTPEAWLTAQASTLMAAIRGTDWVAPAAALEALAKRTPDAAKPIASEVAAVHPQWQVRVTAARVAARIRDAALATRLAADEHPNVRAAALEALVAAESAEVWPAAVSALRSPDYHLVRTAATVLKGAREPAALPGLFDALQRLTGESRDTSRRARLALIERIGELLPGGAPDTPERINALHTLLKDFDPLVATAVAELLQRSSTSPIEAQPTHRLARQPTAERVRTLPPCALVSLEGEQFLTIVLNRGTAPIAVARFLEAAESGHYEGSVIYRDDGNETVFGNRNTNDEGGWPRFSRDEPGARIRRMSLVLLNHGPDTGDGRLALQWHTNPEWDRRATVIGQAHAQPAALSALGLGKEIEKIVVGGEGRLERSGPADPCHPFRPW